MRCFIVYGAILALAAAAAVDSGESEEEESNVFGKTWAAIQ